METNQIFNNNKKWVSEQLELDVNYFENLAKGQAPEYLYIGCSDSRVTAETMMGAKPGELFVHRNIANMVPNTDLSVMSVINYAYDKGIEIHASTQLNVIRSWDFNFLIVVISKRHKKGLSGGEI